MSAGTDELRRVAEPPHLLTEITTLHMPHFDDAGRSVVYDVNVERWASESEAWVYIQERCNPDSPIPYEPVMRLNVSAARTLMATLAEAINAAELQNTVTLPG